MSYNKDRRMGQFFVQDDFLFRKPELALGLMKDILILDARWCYDRQGILYTGIGPPFKQLPEGERAPTYGVDVLREVRGNESRVTGLKFKEFPEL